MQRTNIEYLFNNIKNGDFLSFYHKPWYFLFSKLIFFVTGARRDHVGGICDVKRKTNIVTFKFGEQTTFYNKKLTQYYIVKDSENNFVIDSRFTNKKIKLFYLVNKENIKTTKNKILVDYWKGRDKYQITQLPFVIDWIYKLFGDKDKVYDRTCSTACRRSMELIGIISDPDNKVPDPNEFANSTFIKKTLEIDV
jgi:hypothetical protein